MNPTLRRYSWISRGRSVARFWPPTTSSPDVGRSCISSSRRKVDLPAPLDPVRKTNSPCAIVSERSFSAYRPRLYIFERWCVSITWLYAPVATVYSLEVEGLDYSLALKLLLQQITRELRIRLALAQLHHLTDEKPECLHLAG